jgi:ABC-type uncharacterized transport system auxiliary subunit
MNKTTLAGLLMPVLLCGGCLGARSTPRSYFVLHADPREAVAELPVIEGLVRVRNLDTDAVYEKFQIVVRRSPYQLRYSDRNVWAVKPNQMVADLIGQSLETARVFSAVTRELVDVRPTYTLAGKLHAVEIYDSQDVWYAHLEASLYLTRFSDGGRIWRMDFDQRKKVTVGDFGHAARALSELLQTLMTQAIAEMTAVDAAGPARWKGEEPSDDPAPMEDPTAPVLIPLSSPPEAPTAEP